MANMQRPFSNVYLNIFDEWLSLPLLRGSSIRSYLYTRLPRLYYNFSKFMMTSSEAYLAKGSRQNLVFRVGLCKQGDRSLDLLLVRELFRDLDFRNSAVLI
jgi:hypothetical protein